MKKSNSEILNEMKLMDMTDTLNGCFADIPIEVYHSAECPGVSSTQLKGIVQKSYKHYLHDREKRSDAMDFGSAFHAFVNEPEDFVRTYEIVQPRASKFLTPGMTALKADDFKTIEVMSKKVFQHPDAGPLLNGAQNELTYFFRDQETGILKKVRVDAINGRKIIDLKTTGDASPRAFAKSCRDYLYRISAAYYLEVVSEVMGTALDEFYLIACEKTEPFEVAVYRVPEKSIERGTAEVRSALGTLQKIREEGERAWKGYPTGIKDLDI